MQDIEFSRVLLIFDKVQCIDLIDMQALIIWRQLKHAVADIDDIWIDFRNMCLTLRKVVIAELGVVFFIAGMLTMKGNWRAGVPEKKETSLVTTGIYSISRNPAFVGFDLMYLGIVVAFPNAWHACAAAFTAWLLHKQIKGEEEFLEKAFGKEYYEYKNKVRRYL